MNTEQFIKKAILIHGDKYEYSKANYISSKTKIIIICIKHGEFIQRPGVHLSGSGCQICGKIKSDKALKKAINNKLTKYDDFIVRANKKHNNLYEYKLVNITSNKQKINIICQKHGDFKQIIADHLKGSGCPKCHFENLSKIKTKTTEQFIKESVKCHGIIYDYSKSNYISAHKKVEIICPKHGEFLQTPHQHIRGEGCPQCKESKGEKKIRELLKNNKIEYTPQKRFKDCKNKNSLPFDFYLPKLNVCIEYDGIQHFKAIDNWGGQKELELRRKHDNIKTTYCKNNDIKLIRIKYNEKIEKNLFLKSICRKL